MKALINHNLKLRFADFDFNKTDMKFIQHMIDGAYDPKAAVNNDVFRMWLADRSMNPANVVSYEIRSVVEDGAVVRLEEKGTICLPDLDEVMSVSMAKTPKIDACTTLTADQCLASIDEAFRVYNADMTGDTIGVTYSIRPLIAALLRKEGVLVTYVCVGDGNPYTWEFMTEEGCYTNIITVELHVK